MPIRYALYENHLTDDPNAMMARVKPYGTMSVEDVIDVMIRRGSTVTRAEALAVLEEYSAALEWCLLNGYRVVTPLFKLNPSIRGIFNGAQDPFDPARHRVRINISPGVRLRQIEARAQLKRVGAVLPVPRLLTFHDIASGTKNAQITPGGLVRLRGRHLKYDPDDPQQGLFFIDATGQETRATMISHNAPSRLSFMIPPTLAPGSYKVAVRAILPQTTRLRMGQLPEALSVP